MGRTIRATWVLAAAMLLRAAGAQAQPLPNDIWDVTANCPDIVAAGQTRNITQPVTQPCLGVKGTVNLTAKLSVVTLQVYPGGKFTCRPPAEVAIQPVAPTDPEQYGTGILALGGVWDCQGTPKTSWTRLAAELLAGQSTITVSPVPTGWVVGDELAVIDSREQPETAWGDIAKTPQPERFRIVSGAGATWTLDHAAAYDHPGARNAAMALERYAPVGNLTRDVKIYSENPAGVRGHVLWSGDTKVTQLYTETRNMGRTNLTTVGPANHKARYSAHFHMMFAGGSVDYRGNAVVDSAKWGVGIHSSSNGTYQDNVVVGFTGSGIVTEMGDEANNLIEHNLVAGGIGTGQRADVSCSGDGTLACDGTAFWMQGALNRVRGNVAANGRTCYTQWSYSGGAFQKLAEFTDNEGIGCRDGMQIWETFGGGDMTRQIMWHMTENALFAYPNSDMRLVDWVLRGDPRRQHVEDYLWRGLWFGDYGTFNLQIIRPNVQNLRSGILLPYGLSGGPRDPYWSFPQIKADVTDGVFDNNLYDIRWQQAGLAATYPDPHFVVNLVRNTHGAKSQYHYARLGPFQPGQGNPTAQVQVVDTQKVVGDSFALYSNETAPSGATARPKVLDKVVGGTPPQDADGDGVPDASDKCPGTAPGTAVDGTGCPVVADPDSDGDGVKDSLDKCPGTPAGTPVDAAGCAIPPPTQATVTLDPGTRLQTIHGWEGAVLASIQDYQGLTAAQLNALLDLAVEAGFSRARLAIRNGAEGGGASSFVPVNDNADPNVLDISKFDFSALDYEIDRFIVPLRQKLAAKGERFYTGLQYVDHQPNTAFEHWQNPAEYGEFMQAVFTHMRDKYGFVPDGIDVVNEPNNFDDYQGGNSARLGQYAVAAAQKLQAAGFAVPEFIGPSTVNVDGAIPYFDTIASVPGAAALFKEISYHRYGGVSQANLQAIGAKGAQSGKRTSMLEYWGDFVTPNSGASYRTLHQDLAWANVAAWQQGVFADGTGCVSEVAHLVNGAAELCTNTKIIRQYTKWVRPGAVRIGATGTAVFDPLAFVNADGRYVVVVKAENGSGQFSVAGLPAGTYSVTRAANNGAQEVLADVTVAAGQAQTFDLPYEGALTVAAKTAGPPPADTTPPTVVLSAPANGATVQGTITVSANAADNVGVVGVQFKADGANLGSEFVSPPWSTQWSTLGVADGPHVLTAIARDAAGNIAASNAVTVTVKNQQPPADADGDGVSDAIDQCLGTPAGTPVNSVGCPVQVPQTTTVTSVVKDCTVTLEAAPPDTTHLWSAQIRNAASGSLLGQKDPAAPYMPTATMTAGSYSLQLRWTASGAAAVLYPPVPYTCGK